MYKREEDKELISKNRTKTSPRSPGVGREKARARAEALPRHFPYAKIRHMPIISRIIFGYNNYYRDAIQSSNRQLKHIGN